jgi:hypothetical protein
MHASKVEQAITLLHAKDNEKPFIRLVVLSLLNLATKEPDHD